MEKPWGRPLSPHLSIYKPQISSALSIMHRMTGIGLFIGLVFLTWWLLYITYYPNEIEGVVGTFFATKLGGIFLILWSYALFYHFCNGIRHLIWDFGYGFSIKQMNCTGWLVVFSSILMTMISWVIALRVGE